MQPDPRDPASLADMLQATAKLTRYLTGKSYEALLADEMLQDAVVRQFTVLGEAAARVSEATRVLEPRIAWTSVVGMRNVITHRYDEVDYGELWRTFRRDVPEIHDYVIRLLERVQADDSELA
ncbi:MAG TPA: HepT-like ribonuclease domain-containing protein [Longimicrobium sp.]